mgnify:CR=1 FL=1
MPGGGAGEFDFAFVDAVAGGDVEGVLVEVAVVDATVFVGGFGENELDATGLVENLEAGFGADEEMAGGGGELAVEGTAAIGGGTLGVEVGLGVEGDISAEGVRMDEGAIEVADEELRLIGAEADAVAAFERYFLRGSKSVGTGDGAVLGAGEVDCAIISDHDVVGCGIFYEGFKFSSLEIIGADIGAGGVEGFAIGSEGDAVGAGGVFGKEGFLAIEGDFVEFAVGDIGEVEGAIGGDSEAFGPVVAYGNELPVFAGNEVFGGAGFAFVEVDGDGCFAVVFPEPGESFEEDFVSFLATVATLVPTVGVLVAGEFESTLHRLVGHPPVASIDIEVVFAVLKEDAEGFGFGLADEGGVVVAAAKADVGADHGVDAAEVVGSFPGGGKGGDGSGGSAAEASVIGIPGDVVVLKKGDHFLDEEVGVVGAHAVVFEGAVEAGLGVFVSRGSGDDAGVDKEADGDGHVSGGDELVEGIGNVAFFSGGADETGSVLEDHEAGGLGGVVFGGDVDPVVAGGAGEDPGLVKLVFGELSGGKGRRNEREEEQESHCSS